METLRPADLTFVFLSTVVDSLVNSVKEDEKQPFLYDMAIRLIELYHQNSDQRWHNTDDNSLIGISTAILELSRAHEGYAKSAHLPPHELYGYTTLFVSFELDEARKNSLLQMVSTCTEYYRSISREDGKVKGDKHMKHVESRHARLRRVEATVQLHYVSDNE